MKFLKHIILSLALATGFILLANAQENALQTISSADLQSHLSVIASDSLAGRGFTAEQQGLEMAASYLSAAIKKIGLQPGFENYTQNFNIIKSNPIPENSYLSVTAKNGGLLFQTDSLISLSRSKAHCSVEGEMVFAGFGWSNNKTGYNDFKGVDLEGKIVLYSAGLHDNFREQTPERWDNALETAKIESAIQGGAKAVVILTGIHQNGIRYSQIKRWMERDRFVLESNPVLETIPVVITPPQVADKMLGGKGKFKKYLSSISRKMQPEPFLVEKSKLAIRIKNNVEPVPAKNIIGYVEGNDPVLKNECVIYLAHYDHLGTTVNGGIYNGADDNGSGVVALLEIAEAFKNLAKKLKRSVVFAWVTAEEVGLLGSQFYVQNPLFPLSQTIACINLDMVGRVYEPRDSIWKKSPKLVKAEDGVYVLTSDFLPQLGTITDSVSASLGLVPDKTLPGYFFRSSDHHHFHSRGIPVLNLSTGYHADYHKPSDEISKINFNKMERLGKLAFLTGFELANRVDLKKNKK